MAVAAILSARNLQRFGAIMGAVAVAAGAYGSHGLPSRLKKLKLSEEEVAVSFARPIVRTKGG
jgi:uncharacterized membrane protein YgdD (TMEM256/DUF423 family)